MATLPFTTDKNAVLQALLTKPESVSNIQLQWLRNQYGPKDYMQQVLAPYEHAAFAREVASNNPLAGVGLGLLAVPAYQQAKALGVIGSRTGFQPDQMFSAWRGIGQGINDYFHQQEPVYPNITAVRG